MAIKVEIYRQVPIIALGYYLPENKKDAHTQLISSFKFQGNPDAVKHFVGLTRAILMIDGMDGAPFFVATVPSSTAKKSHKGFPEYFRELGSSFPIKNLNSNLLYRTESKQPAHLGGPRDKAAQIATLNTRSCDRIEGQTVILFDDVIASGNSLKASIDLLLDNKKAIVKLAIIMGKSKR